MKLLSGQMELLSGQMELLSGQMELLSRQMEDLSVQMELLSGQIELLSGQMELLSRYVLHFKNRCAKICPLFLHIFTRLQETHIMARQKRNSTVLQVAQVRAAAIESIGPSLDLGAGLTVENYRAAIDDLQTMLDTYNTRLSELDGMLNTLKASEKELSSLSTRMLAGVAAVYGKESSEYEQAGGTRTSEIKRS